MTLERGVLAVSWLLSIYGLTFGIPRSKVREGVILFFFTQMITWSLSLLFVEIGMIANPVREFSLATRTNFTLNFVFYPTVSTLFGIHYPSTASKHKQFLYQLLIIGGLATGIRMLALHSMLMEHPKFNWLTGAMVLLFGMNAARKYTQWFFNRLSAKGV